jgi:hypothetical protein
MYGALWGAGKMRKEGLDFITGYEVEFKIGEEG